MCNDFNSVTWVCVTCKKAFSKLEFRVPTRKLKEIRQYGEYYYSVCCPRCRYNEEHYYRMILVHTNPDVLEGSTDINLLPLQEVYVMKEGGAEGTHEVTREQVEFYLKEGYAKITEEYGLKRRYPKKVLNAKVLLKHNFECFYCGGFATLNHSYNPFYKKAAHEPEGPTSPAHAVACCSDCRKTIEKGQIETIKLRPYWNQLAVTSEEAAWMKRVHPSWEQSTIEDHAKCRHCSTYQKKNNFVRPGLCRMCWTYDLMLRMRPEEETRIQHLPYNTQAGPAYRRTAESVAAHFRYITTNVPLSQDVKVLAESGDFFQICRKDFDPKVRRITKEMAYALVEQGFAAVVPYQPNIVVSVYAQSFSRFRMQVLRRDKNICGYCGGHATTLDHIIPVSKGGLTTPKNCIAACEECNQAKGDDLDWIPQREGDEEEVQLDEKQELVVVSRSNVDVVSQFFSKQSANKPRRRRGQ